METTTKTPRPYVFVERPRCPACGSVDLHPYKTVQQGDGSTLRYVRCKSCGEKAFLVIE